MSAGLVGRFNGPGACVAICSTHFDNRWQFIYKRVGKMSKRFPPILTLSIDTWAKSYRKAWWSAKSSSKSSYDIDRANEILGRPIRRDSCRQICVARCGTGTLSSSKDCLIDEIRNISWAESDQEIMIVKIRLRLELSYPLIFMSSRQAGSLLSPY